MTHLFGLARTWSSANLFTARGWFLVFVCGQLSNRQEHLQSTVVWSRLGIQRKGKLFNAKSKLNPICPMFFTKIPKFQGLGTGFLGYIRFVIEHQSGANNLKMREIILLLTLKGEGIALDLFENYCMLMSHDDDFLIIWKSCKQLDNDNFHIFGSFSFKITNHACQELCSGAVH